MIEIIALSLIQGITEFLPISSSSHLIIISEYLEFNKRSLEIDISLHIGSFLAVIVFFRKEIFNFVQNKDLFLKILISSFPVMIVGFFLVKFNLVEQIRNIKVIGWTTLIFAVLLNLSDRSSVQSKINLNFTLKLLLIAVSISISPFDRMARSYPLFSIVCKASLASGQGGKLFQLATNFSLNLLSILTFSNSQT